MKISLGFLTVTALAMGALSHGLQAGTVAEALSHPNRPPADLERDERSQPQVVLNHFGIQRGQTVLDLFGGGGYYSEIASYVVGDDGKVILHNNQAYLDFAGDALDERLKDDRLPGVMRYDKEVDAIDLEENSIDLVLMVMTYHDLYYKTDGWDIDPDGFFAMLHRILKPGGVLGIVDHVGSENSGSSAAQELHRIDPAFSRQDIEGHGFRFAGGVDALKNSNDNLDVSVFDPSVQGKTSRFVYKYVEPES
ncbi:MAG: methyltransferase domain-containing protein [Gammaproteobacteria bacterium]|nr:methyltransferase domain-containing protein [Gammaproteobacteria bacterium]